jgi:NTE family protein
VNATDRADLVCEGGGVRGIGLVGAVHALAAAGYEFPRVAGSSAGAVVASMAAALQAAGEPLSRLDELAQNIDYSKFADRTLLARIPIVGPALSLVTRDGLYQGDYLENLLTGLLGDLGVRTFGDLRTGEQPQQYAWSLVVTASDLSRRRLVRIPWDLPNYGVDPDEFSVPRAVRASSAVPFVFEPVQVSDATWVDGVCCPIFRCSCSTAPTARRGGRHSAFGFRHRPVCRRLTRSGVRCRWHSARWKR